MKNNKEILELMSKKIEHINTEENYLRLWDYLHKTITGKKGTSSLLARKIYGYITKYYIRKQ